jgi:hypothetical protein
MAATVTIRRWTGTTGSPTKTDLAGGNTRANSYDTHSTADTTNPVQKPTSGLNYSFAVSTRLSADTTPAGTIDNVRWYADGTNNFGTGISCYGQSATAYKQATGTAGTTGDPLNTSNYTTLTAAPVEVFANFTSGSPKTLSGSISNPSTGDFADFFVYQIRVDTNAGPGASAQETFTFRYDET